MPKKKRRCSSPISEEFPILASLGLYAASTIGDGNCLFRALSDQLYGTESRHHEIRKQVTTYVAQHESWFKAFVSDFGTVSQYAKRMARDGVYGGHIEIVAFANSYNTRVVIYQSDFVYVTEPEGARASTTVHIAYHTWEHYSSVKSQSTTFPDFDHAAAIQMSIGENLQVPRWKVEVVLRSVPFADEDTVHRLLANKECAEVIEDLLMQDLNIDCDPTSASSAQESINAEKYASVNGPRAHNSKAINGENAKMERGKSRVKGKREQNRRLALERRRNRQAQAQTGQKTKKSDERKEMTEAGLFLPAADKEEKEFQKSKIVYI